MPWAPVLVVQHDVSCPPGLVSEWARDAGATLDVRRCHEGVILPASLVGFSGLVVLGGEMGAYSDAIHPWLTAVKDLVIQAVLASLPTLGICLGHQLAAAALGGRVSTNPKGRSRAVLPVSLLPTASDDPVFGGLPPTARLLHWNSDIVSVVPGGASVLAYDARGDVQIVRFGERSWGIQGHPEADHAIASGWGRNELLALPGNGLPGSFPPGTALPGTALPGTALPGTTPPGTALPGTALPGNLRPGSLPPGNAVPAGGGSGGRQPRGEALFEPAASSAELPVAVVHALMADLEEELQAVWAPVGARFFGLTEASVPTRRARTVVPLPPHTSGTGHTHVPRR